MKTDALRPKPAGVHRKARAPRAKRSPRRRAGCGTQVQRNVNRLPGKEHAALPEKADSRIRAVNRLLTCRSRTRILEHTPTTATSRTLAGRVKRKLMIPGDDNNELESAAHAVQERTEPSNLAGS